MFEERKIVFIALVVIAIALALLVINIVMLMPIYSVLASASSSFSEIKNEDIIKSAILKEITTEEGKTITVSGTGTAASKPEVAIVYLSVITRDESASNAQLLNAEKMNSAINALKNAGIKEEQIETTRYSLQPIYEYDEKLRRSVLVGYQCVNTIKVTLEELNKVGKIIDTAVLAGVNEVSSITFSLKEETIEKLKLEALTKAVEDAKVKAETVAKAAGIKIIGPKKIDIGGYISPIRYEVVKEAMAVPETPIIAPEELTVSMNVNIVYEFE
ncbi:MAG: SIMPL domain-containing protein [Nitrososphaerota archaeon]